MIKTNMPNIPGIGAVADTLDFVKNLWGGMGIPGMNMQSMNVPGMVMPTLSVEEINKKITDLKAVESWLTLNMNMLRGTIQALEVQAATISTLQTMGQTFSATMNPGRPSEQGGAVPSSKGDNSAAGSNGSEKPHGAPAPTSKDQMNATTLTAPLVNAAAWWNMLQDQFQQAVSSAMASEPSAATPAKPKAASKTASTSESLPARGGATRKRKTSR